MCSSNNRIFALLFILNIRIRDKYRSFLSISGFIFFFGKHFSSASLPVLPFAVSLNISSVIHILLANWRLLHDCFF